MVEVTAPVSLGKTWTGFAAILQKPNGRCDMLGIDVSNPEQAFEGMAYTSAFEHKEAQDAWNNDAPGTPWGDFIRGLHEKPDASRSFSFSPGYTFHWRSVDFSF